MTAAPKLKYTIEEYLDLLHGSEERLEYFDGEFFSMSGGKRSHHRAAGDIARNLGNLLEGSNCEAFDGQMPVKTPTAPPFRFPDVSVACGEALFEDMRGHDVLLNPVLIVEVLSPSTADYDHRGKFMAYQAIESFREYLLVSQDRPHVTHYLRQVDGSWRRRDIIGLESNVALESLGVTLLFSDIYRRVKFHQADTGDPIVESAEPQI